MTNAQQQLRRSRRGQPIVPDWLLPADATVYVTTGVHVRPTDVPTNLAPHQLDELDEDDEEQHLEIQFYALYITGDAVQLSNIDT